MRRRAQMLVPGKMGCEGLAEFEDGCVTLMLWPGVGIVVSDQMVALQIGALGRDRFLGILVVRIHALRFCVNTSKNGL